LEKKKKEKINCNWKNVGACSSCGFRMIVNEISSVEKMPVKPEKGKGAVDRRYIVSITKGDNDEEDVIWGFKYRADGWQLSAGFKHVKSHPLFRKLVLGGVDNALIVSDGEQGEDGNYVISGPGAGPEPTTTSMIMDAENILMKKES
jgi:homoserine dehydrogenase